MPRLVAVIEGRTKEYELTGETILGRSSQSTIRIVGGKASRQHAQISEQSGNWVIEDLGSSNGTYVNGIKTSRATLKSGDVICIGGTDFTFVEIVNDPLLGKTLGNFHILERIGKGGMGIVYRARQITMDREVALKVLNPDLASNPAFITDFKKEAKLAGRLNHPNIVGIHDVMEEGEHHFMSMELVRGSNLMDMIETSGSLSALDTARYSRQVAEALAHAHKNGIIHQDVKPRNIMIANDGTVKLADLGLAKALAAGPHEDSAREIMGTPLYAPPELIRRQSADEKSDIYSFAATMFHMASGRPPYQGADAETIAKQHLNSPVPDPKEFNPGIPDELTRIIIKGLAKDPNRRYSSCDSIATELTGIEKALSKKQNNKSQRIVPAQSRVNGTGEKKTGDHTDRLPKQNPYKPIAILVFSICSIALALLLAVIIHSAFLAKSQTPLEKELEEIKAMISAGDTDRARLRLMDIRDGHPQTQEAAMAQMLLDEISRTENEKIQSQTKPPVTTVPEQNSNTEPLHKPNTIKNNSEDEARATWTDTILPVIENNIRKGNFDKALKMADTFIENHADAEVTKDARQKRTEIATALAAARRDALAKANELRNNNIAGAYHSYLELITRHPGSAEASSATDAIKTIETDTRTKLTFLRKRIFSSADNLSPANLTEEAASLAKKLEGLPQAKSARVLTEEARALPEIMARLKEVLENGRDDISVKNIGPCRILVDNNRLYATKENSRKEISIKDIDAEDIWKLIPPTTLTGRENLGAALIFAARGHKGFTKSYLTNVPKELQSSGIKPRLLSQSEGYVITDNIDFSDFATQQLWSATEGEWSFSGHSFRATSTLNSIAEYNGRMITLKSLNIDIKATQTERNGQLYFMLARDDSHYIAIRRKGNDIAIELVNGSAPSSSIGGINGTIVDVRLSIAHGKATLFANNGKVAELNTTAAEDWLTRLRIGFVETTGSFDSITINEGK